MSRGAASRQRAVRFRGGPPVMGGERGREGGTWGCELTPRSGQRALGAIAGYATFSPDCHLVNCPDFRGVA